MQRDEVQEIRAVAAELSEDNVEAIAASTGAEQEGVDTGAAANDEDAEFAEAKARELNSPRGKEIQALLSGVKEKYAANPKVALINDFYVIFASLFDQLRKHDELARDARQIPPIVLVMRGLSLDRVSSELYTRAAVNFGDAVGEVQDEEGGADDWMDGLVSFVQAWNAIINKYEDDGVTLKPVDAEVVDAEPVVEPGLSRRIVL